MIETSHFRAVSAFSSVKAETLIPVYTSIAEAVKRHPQVSVMVNFSSFRSVYETSMDCLKYADTIKNLAIIAEGVPESQTREIIKAANEKKVQYQIKAYLAKLVVFFMFVSGLIFH